MVSGVAQPSQSDPVAEYKEILKKVHETRPSGTRRRLAEVLGTNPSFISQISSPAYSTPVPAQYIERLLDLCHFSRREREQFLQAYGRAHPRRAVGMGKTITARRLSLSVPDFGDPDRNRDFDRALEDFAASMARVVAVDRSD